MASSLNLALNNLFPKQKVTLTDSGRSALALAIETLELRGKKILLPAYVCNVLLPILKKYEIEPYFLDINKANFVPNENFYTTEILSKVDAVLLVATYGHIPSQNLIEKIKSFGKLVLEDYAHVNLPTNETITNSDARYYSLPKFLPVPDGGLLITNYNPQFTPQKNLRFSLKNWVKIFNWPQFIISLISILINNKKSALPIWRGIFKPSQVTEKILYYHLTSNQARFKTKKQYCKPILIDDPSHMQKINLKNGIISLKIWHDPIIYYANKNIDDFPVTKYVSRHIICSPE